MSSERQRKSIYLIAGVNGAGKSSVAGKPFVKRALITTTPMKPRDC
jgi:signal recognition particle GTPase